MTIVDGWRILASEPWTTRALAVVRLVDPWRPGDMPRGLSVRSLTPRTTAELVDDRLVVAGRPEIAFPTLATLPQQVVAAILADGRPLETLDITLPAGAPLPFVAADHVLATTPISLVGRVTDAAFPHNPLADATITIGAAAGGLVPVQPPLAAAHVAGAVVTARGFAPGSVLNLLVVAARGDHAIRVSSTAGVAVGSVLALVTGELVEVGSVLSGGVLQLSVPLVRTAPGGSAVAICTPGAAGATSTLARDAQAGDGVLVTASPLSPASVEVAGAVTERRLTTITTDADGAWRLSGVRAFPSLQISASKTGYLTAGPSVHSLSGSDPTVIDVALHI